MTPSEVQQIRELLNTVVKKLETYPYPYCKDVETRINVALDEVKETLGEHSKTVNEILRNVTLLSCQDPQCRYKREAEVKFNQLCTNVESLSGEVANVTKTRSFMRGVWFIVGAILVLVSNIGCAAFVWYMTVYWHRGGQ